MHGLVHPNLLRKIRRLQANPDAIFQLLPLLVWIKPKDRDLPAAAWPQPFQNLNSGRFSRAIRAQQAKHFPRLDFEINPLNSMDFPIRFLERLD